MRPGEWGVVDLRASILNSGVLGVGAVGQGQPDDEQRRPEGKLRLELS